MTSTRRVLVVDDDTTVRRVVRTVLESAGFEVEEAGDGEAALEMFAGGAHHFLTKPFSSIVLLDAVESLLADGHD